ncbi:MAG: hypothetical protein HYR94_08875 [Chloroflexi bacterium]|nr:hypothetical protein [Chloroflexota bacterium]
MQTQEHSTNNGHVSSKEWRFVGVTMIIILIITTLPYIFAIVTAPPDRQFMGILFNVPDHAQYLSWYKGFQTQTIISNTLTPEPNPHLFFNLLWWVLGRIGFYTGLSYVTLYQAFRWLSSIFFLVILYALLARIFSDVQHRRLSFLLITLSSGFGWVLILLKYTVTGGELLFPLDVFIAEGNSFLNIMASPTFIEAAGFILWTFLLLLQADEKQQLRYAVYAGLVAFLLGWQHTYDLWIIWGIPGAYIALRILIDRKLPMFWIKSMLIVGALTWLPALYAVLLTTLNPIWDEILAQFANAGVYSPTIAHMFILIGLPLILALVAVVLRARGRLMGNAPTVPVIRYELFIITWFIVGWMLAYIPTDYQVHMINSWQVPIGILATVALVKYIFPIFETKYSYRSVQVALITGVVGFVMLTNIYLWLWRFVDLARYDYPYYLHKDEIMALEWLEANTEADSVILSSLTLGQFIPAFTNRPAFLAHWAQTVDFFGKSKMVEEFFAADSTDTQRQQTLEQYSVDYIIQGPVERSLGSYDLQTAPFLEQVYTSPEVEIYRVQREQRESMIK